MLRGRIRTFGRLILTSPGILVALLLVAGGAYTFLEVLDEVQEGERQHLDDMLLRLFRRADDPAIPAGPKWLHEVGRDATALGGMLCISLLTGFAAIYLLLERKKHTAMLLLIAVGGGAVVSGLLKYAVARERPDLVPHLSNVYTSSFPSGHSMLSAVAYLTMGVLLAKVTARRFTRLFLLLAAILLTGLVGVSRVYMGVHYPTDVLAGWAAGLTWALLCWAIANLLQRQGAIEGETNPLQQPEPLNRNQPT